MVSRGGKSGSSRNCEGHCVGLRPMDALGVWHGNFTEAEHYMRNVPITCQGDGTDVVDVEVWGIVSNTFCLRIPGRRWEIYIDPLFLEIWLSNVPEIRRSSVWYDWVDLMKEILRGEGLETHIL
jgi:hypothetical protein